MGRREDNEFTKSNLNHLCSLVCSFTCPAYRSVCTQTKQLFANVHLWVVFFLSSYLWIAILLTPSIVHTSSMAFLITLVNENYSQTPPQRAQRTAKSVLSFLLDLGTVLTLTFFFFFFLTLTFYIAIILLYMVSDIYLFHNQEKKAECDSPVLQNQPFRCCCGLLMTHRVRLSEARVAVPWSRCPAHCRRRDRASTE